MVQWVACIPLPVEKGATLLHFAPVALETRAPYAVSLRLTLFGKEMVGRSIVLDGARLGHAESLALDEAFTELNEPGPELVGLEVALTSTRMNLDLSHSTCVLETRSSGVPLFYRAALITRTGQKGVTLLPSSAAMRTSIAITNIGAAHTSSSLAFQSTNKEWSKSLKVELAPHSVREVEVPSEGIDREDNLLFSVEPIAGRLGSETACFVLGRRKDGVATWIEEAS